MKHVFDAGWRAALYLLHPQVILLSLLPLVLMGGGAALLWHFYWDSAANAVALWLANTPWTAQITGWLEGFSGFKLGPVLAKALVLFAALPLIVVASILVVAVLMAPAINRLVKKRRFQSLASLHGAGVVQSVVWGLGATVFALLLLVLSVPLWFVPPLVLVVPPLIWGWLTTRVMAFDALADTASKAERQQILREHRGPLLCIGVVCGYLGAAPSLIGASGAMLVAAAPILIPFAVWVYTLVFAFSALWFAHYCLAELSRLRLQPAQTVDVGVGRVVDVAAVATKTASTPSSASNPPAALPAPTPAETIKADAQDAAVKLPNVAKPDQIGR